MSTNATTPPTPTAQPAVSLNFLYQLIGAKEVENAILREQLAAVQREVAAIQAELATEGGAA